MSPRILVLGGVGMVGRNFVKFCVDNQLCSYIRVADKAMPITSYFSKEHLDAFNSEVVHYVQADLTRDAHLERAFTTDFGPYDYVFNFAGETKFGLQESVYMSKCRDLSYKCGERATQMGVKRFLEVSTAQVYMSQCSTPTKEDGKLDPWTLQARAKLQGEQLLMGIPDLPVIVVRPSLVYGHGDTSGLMPRIVCASAYVKLKETMKLLWDANMRINTVHVHDVCRALWHLSENGEVGQVYNLCDKNDTNQGKLNDILGRLFNIETGFMGKMISNLAQIRLTDVVDDANEKHLRPWLDLCEDYGIKNTPLSPFIDKELLSQNHLYIDGSMVEKTGFQYEYPVLQESELRRIIQNAIEQKIFPPVLT